MIHLTDRISLKDISFKLGLPGVGEVSGSWQPDLNECAAAWEMYVELVTRISVADLGPDDGLLREALNSLYALFGITRGILRAHGPVIAQPKGNGSLSFGYLAVAILNTVLRPVLAHWHPILLDYEARRPAATSSVDWERAWEHNAVFRATLAERRATLVTYADLLAHVAGVPSLIAPVPTQAAA